MDFARSESPGGVEVPLALKILIAGGFGAGKTTMVGSLSEIPTLSTEEVLSDVGIGIDDVTGTDRKETTTVAMDFGRITLKDDLVVYLFGTPGQDRFWFLWDELASGALGAVVLADTRRLTDCFPSIDYFERQGTPFIVAVNCFHNTQEHSVGDIATALDLDPGVPVVLVDARDRRSSRDALVRLVQHVLRLAAPEFAARHA
ncbi:ATP/GTP-binding protein [Cryptosporangium sp. NPDC048952]|uniref:GTP-binding protein n=1 Tax=Cryptosporangium sp. NPDC048952 TaxID=3363961 RepID=UPI003718921A